jgi:RNA polymerase sigma-70 factor (ECF subfamily)
MDQRTLVIRAQAGDVDAFEALVRLASGRLFAIASRILRDHHAAEDAVQQTLVTIWDELPRLRDPERFDAWTYRVIARAAIAQSKRERRGGAVLTLLPDDVDVVPSGTDAIGGVADRDRL